MNTDNDARPKFMRFVRSFAVPILVAWLLVTVALNVLVPPIESVARNHAVTMSPQDAPAMIAAKRIGEKFHESDSDSIAMIVLESDQQLGDAFWRAINNSATKRTATTTAW
jgi:RND superfamily putative drug exporter